MTIDPEANEFLTAGGAPSAKFPVIGTVVKGTVLGATKTQQTDMDGKLLFWDNGDPRWQLVITLQTDERDPDIDGDDGVRRLFAKGNLLKAVQTAVRESGAKGLEENGTLAAKYTADGPKKPGLTAPKEYVGQYAPAPAVALSGADGGSLL